jgi:hypothetical protein
MCLEVLPNACYLELLTSTTPPTPHPRVKLARPELRPHLPKISPRTLHPTHSTVWSALYTFCSLNHLSMRGTYVSLSAFSLNHITCQPTPWGGGVNRRDRRDDIHFRRRVLLTQRLLLNCMHRTVMRACGCVNACMHVCVCVCGPPGARWGPQSPPHGPPRQTGPAHAHTYTYNHAKPAVTNNRASRRCSRCGWHAATS